MGRNYFCCPPLTNYAANNNDQATILVETTVSVEFIGLTIFSTKTVVFCTHVANREGGVAQIRGQ